MLDWMRFVNDIAWFDEEKNCFHIEGILSTQKQCIQDSKCVTAMSYKDGDGKPTKYLLGTSMSFTLRWFVLPQPNPAYLS